MDFVLVQCGQTLSPVLGLIYDGKRLPAAEIGHEQLILGAPMPYGRACLHQKPCY